jgi:hypothetical protein
MEDSEDEDLSIGEDYENEEGNEDSDDILECASKEGESLEDVPMECMFYLKKCVTP